MSNYDSRFELTLNATDPTIRFIAADIGRGFDPDLGGEYSFVPDIIGWNGDTPIYGNTISTSTPCTAEFKAQAEYMMTNPQALYEVLQADYAARWTEFTPPTLAECELFCASIIQEQNT